MIAMLRCDEFEGLDNAFDLSLARYADQTCKIYDEDYEVRGILRISQSLNLTYEAPLDLVIFFDLASALKMHCCFWYLKSSYPNDPLNHKLAKELLKDDFEAFIKKRFNYATLAINATISEVGGIDFAEIFSSDLRIYWGLSKDDTVIPTGLLSKFSHSNLNFDLARDEEIFMMDNIGYWVQEAKNSPSYLIKPPLVKGVFAKTRTKANDFFVNLRDSPSSKQGKIIMQLYSQGFESDLEDEEFDAFIEAQKKAQQAYFAKNKDKMIKPFYKASNSKKDYIIFVDDILKGDWARVRVLRYDDYVDSKNQGASIESKEYINLFLNEPSKITLGLGYIHTSGLAPFRVFEREL
ncbi:hypothetical protein [Campylobacter troglodytis]|uniref:hypothetical protein n=1 Tax=Campylobacter troglodytis TaxID=654363 RepID=UPI00115AF7AD|nr:hypothetical protein [Campylobacter troglodytis]TQR51749.1 hypothetical protein DMC01_12655 [Campylobacter troglodytis]